jgi:hypothetical protein
LAEEGKCLGFSANATKNVLFSVDESQLNPSMDALINE